MELEVLTSKLERTDCRALVLDFDDTLYQLPISWVDYMAHFARRRLADVQGAPTEEELGAEIRKRSGTSLTAYMTWICCMLGRHDAAAIADLRSAFDRNWQHASRRYHRDEYLTPGVVDLVARASASGALVYVLSGGHAGHKRQIVGASCLRELILPTNVIGDGDARMGTPPSKATALTWIGARQESQRPGHERPIKVAMLGDGVVDMQAAQSAGALAIGLGQRSSADVAILSRSIPALALGNLLWST